MREEGSINRVTTIIGARVQNLFNSIAANRGQLTPDHEAETYNLVSSLGTIDKDPLSPVPILQPAPASIAQTVKAEAVASLFPPRVFTGQRSS